MLLWEINSITQNVGKANKGDNGLKKTRCVMTTDKAIELLKSWDGVYIGYSSDDVEEAHNKAISALAFMDVLEKVYKCPSMLLDKSEKLDEIMLAYQKIR